MSCTRDRQSKRLAQNFRILGETFVKDLSISFYLYLLSFYFNGLFYDVAPCFIGYCCAKGCCPFSNNIAKSTLLQTIAAMTTKLPITSGQTINTALYNGGMTLTIIIPIALGITLLFVIVLVIGIICIRRRSKS